MFRISSMLPFGPTGSVIPKVRELIEAIGFLVGLYMSMVHEKFRSFYMNLLRFTGIARAAQ